MHVLFSLINLILLSVLVFALFAFLDLLEYILIKDFFSFPYVYTGWSESFSPRMQRVNKDKFILSTLSSKVTTPYVV